MTWFKIDDRFASHPKLERLRESVGEDHGAFAYAVATWTLMGADCASRLTDGVFTLDRARRVVMLPPDAVEGAIAALVSVGYFESVGPNQWAFHDWLVYQPTREEVEAKRADVSRKRSEAGKKGNEVRWGTDRKIANVVANRSLRGRTAVKPVSQDSANFADDTARGGLNRADCSGNHAPIAKSQADRPVPSRPVPIPNTTEETPTVSLRSAAIVAHAPTQNDPTRVVPVVPPAAHSGGESRAPTLRLATEPTATPATPQRPSHTSMSSQPTGAPMQQPTLFADAPTAPATPSEATDAPKPAAKPRSARKAPSSGEKAPPKEKKARGPHPSVTLACVKALADAAGDRFAMGSKWSDGVWRNLARCALTFPDIAEWVLVGEMLGVNGDGHYDVIGIDRVTDGWFTGRLAVAEKWVANGRRRNGERPFVARTAAPTGIPRGYDSANLTPEQQRAKATGKAVSCGMPEAPKSDAPEHEYNLADYPDCPVLSFGGARR